MPIIMEQLEKLGSCIDQIYKSQVAQTVPARDRLLGCGGVRLKSTRI